MPKRLPEAGPFDDADLDRLIGDKVRAAIDPLLRQIEDLSSALRSASPRSNPAPAPAAAPDLRPITEGITMLLEVEAKREARDAADRQSPDPVGAMVAQVSALQGMIEQLGYSHGPGLWELGIEVVKTGGPMLERFSKLVEVRSRGEEIRNRRFAEKFKVPVDDLYQDEAGEGEGTDEAGE